MPKIWTGLNWPAGACDETSPLPAGELPAYGRNRLQLERWVREDFPAALRYYWDENALMYIRYETMYYAVDLLRSRLKGRV